MNDYVTMITINKGTWSLKSNFAKLGDEKVFDVGTDNYRKVTIDPQLPYLYIPEKDFQSFAIATLTKYGTRDVRCQNNFYHRCIFQMPCDRVPERGLDLVVRVFDSEKSYDMKISQRNLLISGKHFGDDDNKCHLAVMKSSNIN